MGLLAGLASLRNTCRITGTLIHLLFTALVFVGVGSSASAQEVVNFPDPNLEAVIRDAIGIPSGPIYDTDLVGVGFTSLSAMNASISDLTGVEYCTDLTSLNLGENQITDISPVAGLASLTELELHHNQISDISAVAGLANLTSLYLSGNEISDINPVAGLTNLTFLDVHRNQISDISAVAGLINLTSLHPGFNQISDISAVAGLANLTWLSLNFNEISDISPVAGLPNLTLLYLRNNRISDISPLVMNPGIEGSGDTVTLIGNPLSCLSVLIHVPTLLARGVYVTWDDDPLCYVDSNIATLPPLAIAAAAGLLLGVSYMMGRRHQAEAR